MKWQWQPLLQQSDHHCAPCLQCIDINRANTTCSSAPRQRSPHLAKHGDSLQEEGWSEEEGEEVEEEAVSEATASASELLVAWSLQE